MEACPQFRPVPNSAQFRWPEDLDVARLRAELARVRDVEPAFDCLKGIPQASSEHIT